MHVTTSDRTTGLDFLRRKTPFEIIVALIKDLGDDTAPELREGKRSRPGRPAHINCRGRHKCLCGRINPAHVRDKLGRQRA